MLDALKRFRYSKKKYFITAFLAFILVILVTSSYFSYSGRKTLVFADELDTVALEVNGRKLTLRELAFYVAYEEAQVDKQARVYEPDNPAKYWNTHTNRTYIRVAARNAAIQMAVHDEIFYQMAQKEKLVLSKEEEQLLADRIADFWADLAEYGKEQRLGVTREDISATMTKVAYAEKMQRIYAELQNQSYEDYDFTSVYYEEFQKTQQYTIDKELWKRIPFGHVTLDY